MGAVSTCGLQLHPGWVRCCRHDLVVFLLKIHRLHRLLLLLVPEEVQPPVHPPCGPPRHHALNLMVWDQVCRGRPHDLLRVPQHGSPHHHVLLLLHGQHGTQRTEISLVEKISDNSTTHSVPRGPILPSLRKFLHPSLHEEGKQRFREASREDRYQRKHLPQTRLGSTYRSITGFVRAVPPENITISFNLCIKLNFIFKWTKSIPKFLHLKVWRNDNWTNCWFLTFLLSFPSSPFTRIIVDCNTYFYWTDINVNRSDV